MIPFIRSTWSSQVQTDGKEKAGAKGGEEGIREVI